MEVQQEEFPEREIGLGKIFQIGRATLLALCTLAGQKLDRRIHANDHQEFSAMNYRVGPYVYRVQPVEGYIEFEGQTCLGLCDNERHVLYISDQASLAQQVQVVCHEYMEAWIYHFGSNLNDKEDYCDLFGLAMTQFSLDLISELRSGRGRGSAFGDEAGTQRDAHATLSQALTSQPPRAAPGRAPCRSRGDRYRIRKMYQPPVTDKPDEAAWTIHIIEPAA